MAAPGSGDADGLPRRAARSDQDDELLGPGMPVQWRLGCSIIQDVVVRGMTTAGYSLPWERCAKQQPGACEYCGYGDLVAAPLAEQ
jgi:hypothetical protein